MSKHIAAETTPVDSPDTGRTASPEHSDAGVTTEDSPTSTPGGSDDSPSSKDANAEGLRGRLAEHFKKLGDEEAEPEAPEATSTEGEAETGEGAEPEEATTEADEPVEESKPEAENQEGRKRDAQSRIKELAGQVKTLKQEREELVRYTGGPEGFEGFRELVRVHAEEPYAAIPMLEKLLADAKARASRVVPTDDIRKKLDDGLIDDDTAKELEASRAEKVSLQRQREQAAQSAVLNAIDQWEANLRKRTPDFNDDVAEMVLDRFKASTNGILPATPQAALAEVQSAYDYVTEKLRKFKPRQPATKVPASSGSTAKAQAKPRSLNDILGRY